MARIRSTHPAPPMTLCNLREPGVHHLIGFCHNDASRRAAGKPEPGRDRSWGEQDASEWRE